LPDNYSPSHFFLFYVLYLQRESLKEGVLMVFLRATRRFIKGINRNKYRGILRGERKNHPLSLGSSGHFSKDPFFRRIYSIFTEMVKRVSVKFYPDD